MYFLWSVNEIILFVNETGVTAPGFAHTHRHAHTCAYCPSTCTSPRRSDRGTAQGYLDRGPPSHSLVQKTLPVDGHIPHKYVFAPCLRGFTALGEIPLSLLFSRLSSPSSPGLCSQERCSRPFLVFVAFCWTLSSISNTYATIPEGKGEPGRR